MQQHWVASGWLRRNSLLSLLFSLLFLFSRTSFSTHYSSTNAPQSHSMDGAKLTSIAIAIDKAFTASGHRLPTSAYKELVWPGGAAYGINGTNGGRFNVIGGGVPVTDSDGAVLGAVGCSTGTPAQDEVVARAGVEAVTVLVKKEGRVKSRL